MKVDRNFICFGCGERGDVIHFASKLFNMSEYEAGCKLIRDMRLKTERSVASSARKRADQQPERSTCEDRQDINKYAHVRDVLLYYWRLLDEWKEEFAPHSPAEDLHPLYVRAAKQREYVEYLLELLLYGSMEDRKFVLSKEEEVKDFERQLREHNAGGGHSCS